MEGFHQLASLSNYKPDNGHLLELFAMLNDGLDRVGAKEEFLRKGNKEAYFNVLFNRLEARLIEGILLNSFKDYSAFRRNLIKLFKEFAVVRTLIVSDNTLAGIPKAEKLCRQLEKYGMLQLALSLSLEIERHYASVQLDRKYLKYKDLTDRLKMEWEKEFEARRLFAKMVYLIQKKKNIDHLKSELDVLSGLRPSPHFLFNLYYFSTCNLYHQVTSNQDGVLEVCAEATAFFKDFSMPIPYTTEWNFARHTIPLLIQQKQFTRAESVTKRCISLCEPDSYNWHVSLLYLALLGFHSHKPKIALHAYRLATRTGKKFKSEVMEERWLLVRAYLELYRLLKLVHIKEPIKWGKFLNSVPFLEADKGSNNVAVIIVTLLYHLLKRDREKFGDMVAHLPAYINKHLRGEQFARPRYFLHMLCGLHDGSYHQARFERRVKEWERKLNKAPVTIDINISSAEVVPYEWAWKMCKKELLT